MISNAKIRINLKEANEQGKNRWQTLEKTRKYGYLRVFSINTAHWQSQLSQGKSGDFTQKYPLPKINQNEFDTLTLWHFDTLFNPKQDLSQNPFDFLGYYRS